MPLRRDYPTERKDWTSADWIDAIVDIVQMLENQQSTTGTSAGFTAGGGTTATHLSTFTGNLGSTAYTTGDVVRALKQYGILAQ